MTENELKELQKQLKPCPFCGSDVIYITHRNGYIDTTVIVFCNSCKISVDIEENDQEGWNGETVRRAVKAWNRRV